MSKFPVQYARILLKLTNGLEGKALDSALGTFTEYLKKEHATKKIDYILKEYERLAAESAGTEPLEVTAAHELSEDSRKNIETKFGGVIANVTIDETLIGGIIVKKGNTILNTSINAQLESLANSMK